MAADSRTYTAGRFAVDIDGYNVSFCKKFEGLSMEADVVAHEQGPDNFQTKNVANIKWTPGKITVGAGMGKGMHDWIKQSFDKSYAMKNGRVLAADFNYKAQSELTWQNACITSVNFPALDASSKDALYWDVEFEAEQVRWAKGDGSDIRGTYGVKQKAFLASNFRFEMSGLPCDRVSKIDAFAWKCAVVPDHIGIHREPTKHPAKLTIPDIKIECSMADYDAWAQKAKAWFVDGKHLAGDEMQGSITLLDPGMSKTLGTFELKNCGFKKFSKPAFEGNSEKVARFTCEFYCEHITFSMNEYDA
jgi:phage tail-like protein